MRPYSKHKLLPRSREYVFLGYASNSKGYLCLYIATSRLFVSRHVIFDESHFPFRHVSSVSTISSSRPNPWLSNLLFFTPCNHPSILGPHPTTAPITPPTNPFDSILDPYPTTIHSPHIDSILGPHPTTIHSPTALILESSSLGPSIIPSTPLEPVSIIEPIPPPLPNSSPLIAPLVSDLPTTPTSPPPHTLADPSIPTNTHPMTTCAKSGISRKKVFTTSSVNYLQTEPPTCTIASRIPK